ncbi:5'-nucleotidase [Nocardioides endophyticus]|uniref:5'-nucleotidase n=1 Tax=Nocardioides endophyticus TaxID=1353775 RepID=UPI003CD07153
MTSVLRPQIYFDDQQGHLASTSTSALSVHVPFGALHETTEERVPDNGRGLD